MQVFVEKRQLKPGRMLQKSEVVARAQSKTWWGTKMPQLSARWKPSRTIQFSARSSLPPCWTVAWVSIRAYGLPCVRRTHQLWADSASSCSAACRTPVRPLPSFIKSYSILGQMSDGFLSSLWELKGTCKWSTWQGVKQALKICSFYLAACWITWRFMYSITENLVCVWGAVSWEHWCAQKNLVGETVGP